MPAPRPRTYRHQLLHAVAALWARMSARLDRSAARERRYGTANAIGSHCARVALTLASLASAASAAPAAPTTWRAPVAPLPTDPALPLDADAALARLLSLAATPRSRAIAADPLLVRGSVCRPDSTERPHANASCESSLLLRGTLGNTTRATLTVHWHDARFVGFVLHLPPPSVVDLQGALARRFGPPLETVVSDVEDASGRRPVQRAVWRTPISITMLELERDAIAGDTLAASGLPPRAHLHADVSDSRSLY
jgi:hypothetical protein